MKEHECGSSQSSDSHQCMNCCSKLWALSHEGHYRKSVQLNSKGIMPVRLFHFLNHIESNIDIPNKNFKKFKKKEGIR